MLNKVYYKEIEILSLNIFFKAYIWKIPVDKIILPMLEFNTKLHNKVEMTMVNGNVAYENGTINDCHGKLLNFKR